MKKKYQLPKVKIVHVEPRLLQASNFKSNANLKSGGGGSAQARSRSASFYDEYDNESEE